MYNDRAVNQTTEKPEMIHFYNKTKGGFDIFNQLNHSFSVSKKTRSWPLRYLYGMLDQASVNVLVLFRNKHNSELAK